MKGRGPVLVAAVFALTTSLALGANNGVVVDGIAYGPRVALSGVYFTNFENSKFIACASDVACKSWISSEQEWLTCEPAACAALEARVRTLNGSSNRWGTFRIEFFGRRTLHPSAKASMYDTPNKVLLERLVRLTKIAD